MFILLILIYDKIRFSLAAVCPSDPCKNCSQIDVMSIVNKVCECVKCSVVLWWVEMKIIIAYTVGTAVSYFILLTMLISLGSYLFKKIQKLWKFCWYIGLDKRKKGKINTVTRALSNAFPELNSSPYIWVRWIVQTSPLWWHSAYRYLTATLRSRRFRVSSSLRAKLEREPKKMEHQERVWWVGRGIQMSVVS